MTDIYDIKPLLLWNYINLSISLIFIIIFVIVYFVLFKKRNRQLEPENEIIIEIPKVRKIDYMPLLQDIENNLEFYNSEVFYHKIDKILRLYLNSIWFRNIKFLTLKELEKIKLDKIFIDLFKNIYFKEYSKSIEDSVKLRQKYLLELKNLVLNK